VSAIQSAIQMRSIAASYTTRNRLGIYIFQYRIPARFKHNYSSRKLHFRKSLKTRNKRVAVKRARQWIMLMDELAKKYFHDPSLYKAAMQLLAEHEVAEHLYDDWLDYESNFLSMLDLDEDKLLERAISYKREFEANTPLQVENDKLKLELQTLKNVVSSRVENDGTGFVHDKKYTTKQNPTLAVLFEQWKVVYKESMAPSSFEEYSRMIELFIRVINEYNSQDITANDLDDISIRHYKDVLQKIPSGVKTEGKTVESILSIEGKPKSKSTIKNALGNVGHFIRWMMKEGYPVTENLHAVLTSFPNVKANQKKRRYPFDDEDLAKLFNSDDYIKGLFKSESDYWAPLIALFTGATMGEILQLHINDIYTVDSTDTYVIDINSQSPDKALKVSGDADGDGRPRIIPVHPQLIKLKFIDFVASQKDKGLVKLFPAEERNHRGQFRAYSGRFGRYRKKAGAGPRNKNEFRDFHSFRHLMKSKLSDVVDNDGLIDDVLGHTSSSRSTVGQRYNHADRLDLKLKALKKVKYDCIDFSAIKDWKFCEFSRKQHN
jgi:integrase